MASAAPHWYNCRPSCLPPPQRSSGVKKGQRNAAHPRRHPTAARVARGVASATLFAAIAPAFAAQAPSVSWDRGADTLNWGDAANWRFNAVPTADDDVWFANTGIAPGDAFDLGGTTRSINSLRLDRLSASALDFSLGHGTLNLRGTDTSTGLNLNKKYINTVTVAADLLLGDAASTSANATFAWNSDIGGSLVVTGALAKAKASQAVSLSTGGQGTILFTNPAVGNTDTLMSDGLLVFRPTTAGALSFGTGTITTGLVSPFRSGGTTSFVLCGSTSQEYALSNAFKPTSSNPYKVGATITLESMPGVNPTFTLTGRQYGGVNLRLTGQNANPVVADVRGDVDLTGMSLGTAASPSRRRNRRSPVHRRPDPSLGTGSTWPA